MPWNYHRKGMPIRRIYNSRYDLLDVYKKRKKMIESQIKILTFKYFEINKKIQELQEEMKKTGRGKYERIRHADKRDV